VSGGSAGADSLEHRDLVEIRGPSALGGGWRRARDLLYLMAVAEFRRSYLGTALGYLWSFARPLMLFGVLLLVFTQAFDLGERVQQYPVLLLFNIVLFGFFQEATVLAVGSIVASEPIVRRTQFPRLVIPLSVVLTSLFTLAANLVVVFVFILVAGVEPRWTWLLLPVIVAALTVFTTAVSMIVSALNPRFRDTGIIWSVAVTALFYATPVLYPLEIVPGTLGRLLALNPLAPIFELARKWVIDPDAPGPAEAAGGAVWLLIPAALYVAVCVLAVWIFNREAPRIAEEL
jgi:ABC-2 type transport system permease protein